MSRFGRNSVYFAIAALLCGLAPAANMLLLLLENAKVNPGGISSHPTIYLIWIGQTGFYAAAILLLIATLRRDGWR